MSHLGFDALTQRVSTVLDLREQQHALTATNLANADTPGFQAKVIDFSSLLSDVMDGRNETQKANFRPEIHELRAPDWAPNGNSVTPEREMARMEHNSTMFGAVSKGISRRIALMKFAASDGR